VRKHRHDMRMGANLLLFVASAPKAKQYSVEDRLFLGDPDAYVSSLTTAIML
jgi:hypothetical protein